MSGLTITNNYFQNAHSEEPQFVRDADGWRDYGNIEVMTKEECEKVAKAVGCQSRKEWLKVVACGGR